MQRIAADVGYSESAFLAPDGSGAPGRLRVRYFSPAKEIAFCGHATIASGVALADEAGRRPSSCAPTTGTVDVDVERAADGRFQATLTSVEPWVRTCRLTCSRACWSSSAGGRTSSIQPCHRPSHSPACAIRSSPCATCRRSRRLDYDFESMRRLMLEHDLTTLQLLWREAALRFRARDPFAAGGVVEDPATGAAAAALGAYLRERGEVTAPATFEISQGVEMGRPSLLTVSIVADDPRIRVSGTAVPIPLTPG
jgi:predicted PhzF superfamily epimerase YddE/YHI9